MAGSGDVKGALNSADTNLRRVGHYLTSAGGSAEEPEMRSIGELFDVAELLLELWRTATGVDGATKQRGQMAGKLSEVSGLLFRVGRSLPVNGDGNVIESHLRGTANTLDALINLLSQAIGTTARSRTILRKEAINTHQTAVHRYALAFRAPDTVVAAVLSNANHEGRIHISRSLHRGVVDMAGGVEAWTR